MSFPERDVLDNIPQREPFLFVDKILQSNEKKITTEKKLTGEEDFFKGHFPGLPIMPGVLLCETIFQSGSLLIGGLGGSPTDNKIGVVVKIEKTKFKNFVKPGDKMITEVTLLEQIENAFYMKGNIKVNEKLVCSTNFTCALTDKPIN